MKYTLNKTPIKTTKSFNVNDVKVDLELEDLNYSFHEYEINTVEGINCSSTLKDDFSSRIGLNHKSYKELNINVPSNKVIDQTLKINYIFNEKEDLIDNININVDSNSIIKLFIDYKSITNDKNFHNGNININVEEGSTLDLIIINELNENSINIFSSLITCHEHSKIKTTLLDLGGNIRIYNFESSVNNSSESTLNNIYIGQNNDLIDMNYNYVNKDINSKSIIEVEGLLKDSSHKNFKGIIDFKSGSTNSIGKENENCLLLSDEAVSRSLPVLLCGEENVDGTHSVSSGKIDENKLFYLMSRGLSETEAKKVIISSNFKKIIDLLPDEIKEDIENKINNYI